MVQRSHAGQCQSLERVICREIETDTQVRGLIGMPSRPLVRERSPNNVWGARCSTWFKMKHAAPPVSLGLGLEVGTIWTLAIKNLTCNSYIRSIVNEFRLANEKRAYRK